jgi:hypothetical protein
MSLPSLLLLAQLSGVPASTSSEGVDSLQPAASHAQTCVQILSSGTPDLQYPVEHGWVRSDAKDGKTGKSVLAMYFKPDQSILSIPLGEKAKASCTVMTPFREGEGLEGAVNDIGEVLQSVPGQQDAEQIVWFTAANKITVEPLGRPTPLGTKITVTYLEPQ